MAGYPSTSIESLMDSAELVERLQPRSVRPRTDFDASTSRGRGAPSHSMVRQPQSQPFRSRTGPMMPCPGACYICQATDHWANACPQRASASQSSGRGQSDFGRERGTVPPRSGGGSNMQRGGRFGYGSGRGLEGSPQSGRDIARIHATIGEKIPSDQTLEVYQDLPLLASEMHEDVDLITGILFISSCPAYVLIDTGASHSFVSLSFVSIYEWSTEARTRAMEVQTPLGKQVLVDRICKDRKVRIDDRDLAVSIISR